METISIPGAEIYYDRNFLPPEEATSLFHLLREKCAGARRKYSCKYAVPRDQANYGDPGTNYTDSQYKPLAGMAELRSLKHRVEEATPEVAYANLRLPKLGYNAVLCNLYRNGRPACRRRAGDGVGNRVCESGSGTSVSPQKIKWILSASNKSWGTVVFAERLPHGSLFIMAGQTQKNFKHEVLERTRATARSGGPWGTTSATLASRLMGASGI